MSSRRLAAFNRYAQRNPASYAAWMSGPGGRYLGAAGYRRVQSLVRRLPRRRVPGRGRFGFGRTRGTFQRALYTRSRRPEVKNFDIVNDGLAFGVNMAVGTTAQSGNLLVGITQGTTENNRIGREILVKSVHIRGILEFNPTVTVDVFDHAIIYVILDTQANGGGGGGTPCVLADLFSNVVSAEELLNMDNTQRFRVLRRAVYQFETKTLSAGTNPIPQACLVDLWIPCNMRVVYSAATGTISEIRDNNIFLAYGSSTGKCVFAGAHRVRFTDV